jgi:hypothetical protein
MQSPQRFETAIALIDGFGGHCLLVPPGGSPFFGPQTGGRAAGKRLVHISRVGPALGWVLLETTLDYGLEIGRHIAANSRIAISDGDEAQGNRRVRVPFLASGERASRLRRSDSSRRGGIRFLRRLDWLSTAKTNRADRQ